MPKLKPRGSFTAPSTELATVQSGRCEAYGCPLTGSMSHGTSGHGPWWCYIHFFVGPLELQRATATINKNTPLLERIRAARASNTPEGRKELQSLRAQLEQLVDKSLTSRQAGED